ncbi:unnamed protein product, partial [Owenia fusiformis]
FDAHQLVSVINENCNEVKLENKSQLLSILELITMASEKVVQREVARLVNAEEKYVCSLDAKSIVKAQKELKENPKERQAIVDQLRKWIMEQPHFKCSTGKGDKCFTKVMEI